MEIHKVGLANIKRQFIYFESRAYITMFFPSSATVLWVRMRCLMVVGNVVSYVYKLNLNNYNIIYLNNEKQGPKIDPCCTPNNVKSELVPS